MMTLKLQILIYTNKEHFLKGTELMWEYQNYLDISITTFDTNPFFLDHFKFPLNLT